MFYQVISLDKRNYINRVRNIAKGYEKELTEYIEEQLFLGANFEVQVKKYEGKVPGEKPKI